MAKTDSFFKFTTTRPVAILMVVIGVSVFGFISYKQLPLNLMPDISYPSLTVRTEYEGTAPEEIETTISRPIEQEVGVVDNLVSITSVSKAGQSDIIMEYSWNTNMNEATAELREKLDRVWLPLEVKKPLILRYDPSLDPIMRLGLYGDRSLFYMRYLAEEDIKRILETVDGVAAIKVKGGLEEEIRVELNEQQLTLIGINIQQVRNRLAQENINLAGGNLKEGQTEYIVRTLNEFKRVEEIGDVVIGNWNGREVKIKDVGRVHRTNKEREIITRIDGQESVEIEIFKEADANIVAVAERVKNIIFGTKEQQDFAAELKEKEAQESDTEKREQEGNQEDEFHKRLMTNFIAYNLPTGINIGMLSDQSVFIENAVNEVKSTAVIGGLLAVLVLFVFLRNFTMTMIVGISIPISVIATFAPMKIFHVSLNIMSLGGLALGIGMLVDNSIVVLESIARCREEGDSMLQATVRGVHEVGGAVFASTLTTIAVFFPIVFVQGVAGQVFGDMSLTVVFSLLASLAVALFLIPMLASRKTEQFVQGVNVASLVEKNFLSFKAEQILTNLEKNGSGSSSYTGAEKVRNAVKAFLMTIVELIIKILISLAALSIAVVKYSSLFILVPVMPLFALLRLIRVIKFKISDVLFTHAQKMDYFGLNFVKDIWANYLVFNAAATLYSDLTKQVRAFKGKSVWRILLVQWIVFLVTFIFFLFKYALYSMVELVFRFIHYIVIMTTIILKSVFILAKIVLALPVKIILTLFNWVYNWIEEIYPRMLNWSLHNKALLIGTTVCLFALVLFGLGPRIGSELIPEVHQGEFNLELTLPVGSPAEQTDERVKAVQEYINQLEGVARVATVVGTDKTETTDTEQGEHTAKLTISLKRTSSVLVTEERLIKDIREHMKNYSGIKAKISRPTIFSFKTPIEVEIHGYNLTNLQSVVTSVEEQMRKIPGLFDVKANVQRGNPEVQIVYNRQLLSRYGLNVMEVATLVRNKVRGDIATEFKEEDRRIDIRVRVREEDKETIDNLRRLIINPAGEKPLPLEAVADIVVNEGPSEIRRIDQQRTAVISANISGRDLKSAGNDIYAVLQKTDMPADFTYDIAGQNKEMETSLNSLMLALALAIFLVYIVMASQFESLLHPFIIIFTIPLALIGVIIFLWILKIPASIVVFLGLIMLAGIVVNNAIVLVDYINRLRARGMAKLEAITTAGKVRLRPILMTTSTTVLGLLPMALGLGDGAEIRTPMAITVIVGLVTSTVLTLIVIPTVYYVLDRKA
jgi:multidrug efflux pump subunit AcrB